MGVRKRVGDGGRRRVRGMTVRIAALAAALAVVLPAAASAQAITVRDLAGRTVRLEAPARRIVIDDARYLVALSLLHPDPVSLLAGWPRDINRLGAENYAQYRARFPAIERLPQTSSSAGTFSVEHALAARPDLAVYTVGMGPNPQQVAQLERAGIPVVFIDFFSQPLERLEPSLRLLGAVIGRNDEARAFIELRRERLEVIRARLAQASPTRPKVFLEAHAGMSSECCNSPGKGNIGDYIQLVGGHNIGADVLPSAIGRLSMEYVISRNPDLYIATGGPHLARTGGLAMGTGYTAAQARAALTGISRRSGIAQLGAVRGGRVHGISHQLLNSPLDILAVEALAKWIRPDLFADLDPAATLAVINRRFLAVPLEGTHWVSLR